MSRSTEAGFVAESGDHLGCLGGIDQVQIRCWTNTSDRLSSLDKIDHLAKPSEVDAEGTRFEDLAERHRERQFGWDCRLNRDNPSFAELRLLVRSS
jgi:hypothetical protein